MKGFDIARQVKEQRSGSHCFIKWWRKEEDFLDFDLIDNFINDFKGSEEIEGFELIGMDQMWQETKRVCGERVTKVTKDGNDVIQWVPSEGKEAGKKLECPYTPEALLTIFDRETRGNPVD